MAHYRVPQDIEADLLRLHPDVQDTAIALKGLRQWLRLQIKAPNDPLGMPSKAVGLLWSAFTQDAPAYGSYCRKAFGPFWRYRMRQSHRSPEASTDVAIARTFALACHDEDIQIPQVLALPALFAVDARLEIPDGQWWTLDCGEETCKAEPPYRCVHHDILRFIPRELRIRLGRPIDDLHSSQFTIGGGPYISY